MIVLAVISLLALGSGKLSHNNFGWPHDYFRRTHHDCRMFHHDVGMMLEVIVLVSVTVRMAVGVNASSSQEGQCAE
jgi:hypothetical protein